MKKTRLKWCVAAFILIVLPILGIWLEQGKNLAAYLEFPPQTMFVEKAAFSWIAFAIFLSLLLFFLTPFVFLLVRATKSGKSLQIQFKFPWWGWLGLISGGIMWGIAWTRWESFHFIQEHTFFPLWVFYIITINALTYRRTGACMLTRQTPLFLILFPVSALFWWFFEYLNRFVQNWSYFGVQYPAWKYFLIDSLSFSTVLPAVLGTREWLLSFVWSESLFFKSLKLKSRATKPLAMAVFILFSLSLVFIGIFPDYLFPMVWVSPLVVLLCLNTLFQESYPQLLNQTKNQRLIITSMIAALICGFFWEMWNFYSLVKWHYEIPFVNRFKLFEMPILGYGGYLPFGLECALIGHTLNNWLEKNNRTPLKVSSASLCFFRF